MNIRVNLNSTIADGSEVVFRSPADCSQVTGLVIYHTGGKTEFAFADAHGNNVGDIDHLFAENAVVKVILDVTAGMAFVQNADTNAYIERTFIKSVNGVKPDSNGNVEVKVSDAIGSGYTDVTEAYEQALADGAVSCAKEYLWCLVAGRYSITERNPDGEVMERYYLQALAGEESAKKTIIGRILYRVSDFMFVEYYTEDRAYTEAPKFCLDGDGEILYEDKTILPPDGVQIDDGILHLIRNGKPVGQGAKLPKSGIEVSGAEVGQILKVKEVDEHGVPTVWETAEPPKGDEWELIANLTLEEDVQNALIDKDVSGNPFSLRRVYALFNIKFVTTDGANVDKTYTAYKGTIDLNGLQKNNPFYKEVNLYYSGNNCEFYTSAMCLETYGTDGSIQGWLNDSCAYVSNRKLGFQTTGTSVKLPKGIQSLKIYPSSTNHVLATGTQITLYGVRK